MKKTFYRIFASLALLVSLASCDNWFDVTPSTQNPEDDQFSTEAGFKHALTGCYINLVTSNVYVSGLTFTLPELIAQQYTPHAQNSLVALFNQNYTNATAETYISNIWSSIYNAIANVNKILEWCETNREVLDDVNYQLIKGELLAMRGFFHLDLLRNYGIGNLAGRSDWSNRATIPYIKVTSIEIQPQQTYSEALKFVIEDLTEAVSLLAVDPITESKEDSFYELANKDGYWSLNRNDRFNYYAAQAILARAYMWRGSTSDMEAAAKILEEIIPAIEEKGIARFNVSAADIMADYNGSAEAILRLEVQDLYSVTSGRFTKDVGPSYEFFYTSTAQRDAIYESGAGIAASDLRYSVGFFTHTESTAADRVTSLKYLISLKTNSAGNVVNQKGYSCLIRLPELYYMLSECQAKRTQPNMTKALESLNKIRSMRILGVAPLTETEVTDVETLENELAKEYRKEFIAEGHYFYFCKRNGLPVATLEFTDEEFMLPYPEEERAVGRVQ